MEELLFVSCLFCVFFILAVEALRKAWETKRIRCFYTKQGIPGPPFRFIVGNIPEIRKLFNAVPKFETSIKTVATKFRVIPDLATFQQVYGRISVHELGSITRILLADEELLKKVLISRSSCYTKADLSRKVLKPIVGKGIVFADGELWRQQRRILNPAFKLEYLKGLMGHMSGAGNDLAKRWSSGCGEAITIDAHREMAALTLDVIARASFGASLGGTDTGYAAFECLDELLSKGLLYMNSYRRLIPGYSFLPTPEHLHLRRSERYVNKLLREIIRKRWTEKSMRKDDENGSAVYDLLDMMLEAVENKSPTMTMEQLLDECKTIFFAGHSPTALMLTWTLVMLSIHQDWQQRAREEILEAQKRCGVELSSEDLSGLEVVGWIIHEVLRLFPPVSSVTRQCHQAHTIGEFSILPGTVVLCPLALLLQRKELWGDDAYEFNPERFAAKSAREMSGSFMAFSVGTRRCLGMNFALLEARLLLSLLLSKFSFTLAQDYVHAPGSPLNVKPVYGAPLVVRKLCISKP